MWGTCLVSIVALYWGYLTLHVARNSVALYQANQRSRTLWQCNPDYRFWIFYYNICKGMISPYQFHISSHYHHNSLVSKIFRFISFLCLFFHQLAPIMSLQFSLHHHTLDRTSFPFRLFRTDSWRGQLSFQ